MNEEEKKNLVKEIRKEGKKKKTLKKEIKIKKKEK